jgi:hypothetical protein
MSTDVKILSVNGALMRHLGPGHVLVVGLVLYVGVLRPRLMRWGAGRQEIHGRLPGDDLVAARWQTTRGITISAPAAQVWPWLIQMGYGRGGWYSYDGLERLAGAGAFAEGASARRVVPELQGLKVGDTVALSKVGGLTVVVIDPPCALVLRYRMSMLTGATATEADWAVLDWTWSFVLTPVDDASCRLVVRVRANYRPAWLRAFFPLLLEPVHFVMERKMLRSIERRASAKK